MSFWRDVILHGIGIERDGEHIPLEKFYMTHSKDFLAAELRKAGLNDLAAKAEQGHYHDYLSPLPDPAMELDRDLVKAGTPAAAALRARHHNGEFDATFEESEDWANSPEGKAAINEVMRGK